MAGRTVFLGGIHGVGKGTLGQELVRCAKVSCVSASTLIREFRPSDDGQKRVEHVGANQTALLDALSNYRVTCRDDLVLDGHFVLFDKDGEVQEIEERVFEAINPHRLLLMVDEVDAIHERLLARDKSAPPLDALRRMAELERRKAEEISEKLGLSLKVIAPGYNIQEVLDFLELGWSGPA